MNRVYAFQGWRAGKATREIIATTSKAAVARTAGVNRPNQLFNLNVTANPEEMSTASAAPGRLFWRLLDAPRGSKWECV